MRRKSNSLKSTLICGLLLMSFLTAPEIHAWKKNLRFERLTPEDGLSHVLVDSIAQDHQGFMWFGAMDGLNKYDGYNFTFYGNDPDDPTSISSGQVLVVFVDSEGVLWAAADELNRFDREKETFTRFSHDPDDPGSISGEVISIFEDRAGTLWFGTWNQGLNRYDRETESFTHFQHDPADPNSLPAGAVYVFTRSGTQWSQQAYLKASNTDGDDWFGNSVGISGDSLIVGAIREGSAAMGLNGEQSDNSSNSAGAVYLFTRNGTVWSQQDYFKASNTDADDNFGMSVAISGYTTVVSAWQEDSNAQVVNGDQNDNSAENSGAAYVFDTTQAFSINAGHAGAWFNPETSGQGQFIDVEPESQFMFVSWFTYTDAATDNPFEQRWLTAQGNYSGNTAALNLFETLGGQFDDPQMVTTTQVGEVILNFSDCGQGQITYSLDEEELQGEFALLRVIPGSGNVCEEFSGNTTQAVDINAGMDGAWFDPDTAGQGFFIDAHPDPEGGNFIFVSWFTYGDNTASGQRWLTAQGSFEGSIAEIDVFETIGGSFDDPQAPSTTQVGTMRLNFTDCSNAQLTYSLPANGAEGDIAISRVIPSSQALCEELVGQNE